MRNTSHTTTLDTESLEKLATLRQSKRFARNTGKGGKLVHVVGARPNFVKLAPLHRALDGARQEVIHTGQHYDRRMSGSFFETLEIPEPDINLGLGGGTHAVQTARIMTGLEECFETSRPAAVIVYGDVNSTLAASLVATKLHIPCIHVEAGLRSGDRDMPEEVNRLVTDRLSDLLLTPSREADETLLREGTPREAIHFVGNIMIDSLARLLPRLDAMPAAVPDLPDRFVLVTLHRPSNVDDPVKLTEIVRELDRITGDIEVVFPVHPRTRARLDALEQSAPTQRLRLIDPLDYPSFIALQRSSVAVVTDSGGIQEETTWLGRPCLTLRDTTERPVTIDVGTNILLGDEPSRIHPHVSEILAGRGKTGSIPEFWDGQTAQRIRAILEALDLCTAT